jgi:hypothetical protein
VQPLQSWQATHNLRLNTMPLQATSGAASYDAFGGGVPVVPAYIEEVFSTYLYTGNDVALTVTNGIDLSTKGGLVWGKSRSGSQNHRLYDTARGSNFSLISNATSAQSNQGTNACAFNTDGFSLSAASGIVGSATYGGPNYVSWTFRKQPKFFDVVTYTGNGTTQNIAHNLGSVPGCIIVKEASAAGNDWQVYHRSTTNTCGRLFLNLTNAENANGRANTWGDNTNPVPPTSTVFTVGNTGAVNNNGATFVAYLFAHDAGGFGLTGTDNVISCGSVDTGASGTSGTVNLGWEPQFVIMKRTNGVENWMQFDNMRGLGALYAANKLNPNTTGAEQGPGADEIQISSTGLTIANVGTNAQFIYIAIRRGPMRAPTSGASVFSSVSATPSGATNVTTNFPVDLAINAQRDSAVSGNKVFWDRLRGSSTSTGKAVFSNLTNAEVSYASNGIGLQSNTTIVDNYWNTLNGATTPVIYWNFRRAPSFFDEVCYTGTGVTHTETHNLGVAPELIIVKRRASATASWAVYAAPLTASYVGFLDLTNAFQADNMWNSTAPTSTAFTVRAANAQVNASGSTYVAYLFATCAGVSKVGSYTGNGSSQTINCGFTSGARFVLIKATSAAGQWRVYDTARGIVAGNEPELFLNLTDAEQTVYDAIDTASSGFIVNSNGANVNDSGVTYIFLAIA